MGFLSPFVIFTLTSDRIACTSFMIQSSFCLTVLSPLGTWYLQHTYSGQCWQEIQNGFRLLVLHFPPTSTGTIYVVFTFPSRFQSTNQILLKLWSSQTPYMFYWWVRRPHVSKVCWSGPTWTGRLDTRTGLSICLQVIMQVLLDDVAAK